MKLLLLTVLIGLWLSGTEASRRTRRNLIQFHAMIKCVTGRSSTDYLGYGCYCGLGGYGQAVDDIDRCCQEHDQCYKDLPFGCFPKLVPYKWDSRSCPETRCKDNNRNTCRKRICECDLEAARCFKQYDDSYDDSKLYLDKSDVC